MTATSLPVLEVTSEPFDDDVSLLDRLDPVHPLAFLRRGDGMVGIGEATRLEFDGPDRLARAADAWRRLADAASVVDTVGAHGSGLIAFGAFAFDDRSPMTSVLIVPRIVLGRRGGSGWITRIGARDDEPLRLPAARRTSRRCCGDLVEGEVDAERYRANVALALDRIRSSDLQKVVLARDLVGTLSSPLDLRTPITALAMGYPDTWTYAVDGLFGSSPETLVTASGRTVTARVLAGSAARGVDPIADERAAAELATSAKDLDEHGFAVRSVLAALRPFAPEVTAGDQPFTLKLPNLWHLASDVEGRLADRHSVLDLVAALHPTAAVAGTPRDAALALIRELEPDRGRYAGPVGWIDAAGDGEWAIALRGAQVDATGRVRAHAGAGIVEASVPERELAETALKFRPIREAFAR